MSKIYLERYQLALDQDTSIACTLEELTKHKGSTETYLGQLGLEKQHLKRLERDGLAIRGKLPTMKGDRIRWILVRK